SRRGVLHGDQWTAAAGARDRAEATRHAILEGPLPVGLARRRRSEPGDGTEPVLVGSHGEAVSRTTREAADNGGRIAEGGIVTTSTILAGVEGLIRRAEALETGGASAHSQAIASRLRSTVLRPLTELDTAPDPSTDLPPQTAEVDEALFELALELTRACATD